LSKLAKKCWREVVKILEARGTLTLGDGELLLVYATTKERFLLAKAKVDAEGLQVRETRYSRNGGPYEVTVTNPMLEIQMDAEAQMLAIASKLGLTPVDRDKPKPVTQKPKVKSFSQMFGVKKEQA
jgi:P27 family predicted phage terminase small subunit